MEPEKGSQLQDTQRKTAGAPRKRAEQSHQKRLRKSLPHPQQEEGKKTQLRLHRKNPPAHIWNFYSKNNFKIQTCLFILARFSASESLRVFINILKIPPPFASNEGYPASGFRYESAGALVSNPLPHIITITIGSVGRREGPMNKQVCILKLFLE